MWPLALFYWVYPHTLTLLWLQDVAVVGGELVVVAWVKRGHHEQRTRPVTTRPGCSGS